jgi:hypothetical protein
MRPHAVVHRRRDQQRPAVRERGLAEDVVGQAVRELGERVRGQRRDDEQVSLRQVRVRALVDGTVGERRKGLAGDEALGARRHERDHLVPGAHEAPSQFACFVSGDAAGHTEKNSGHLRPLSSCSCT